MVWVWVQTVIPENTTNDGYVWFWVWLQEEHKKIKTQNMVVACYGSILTPTPCEMAVICRTSYKQNLCLKAQILFTLVAPFGSSSSKKIRKWISRLFDHLLHPLIRRLNRLKNAPSSAHPTSNNKICKSFCLRIRTCHKN